MILGQQAPSSSSTALSDDEVMAAYPWPENRRWVRAMMVTTLDGSAVGPDHLSGSISGDADRLVFRAVRRMADAVLIGAGTLRGERYGAMRANPADAAARQEAGLAPAPRLAILSGSLDLPWDDEVFSDSALPPLVLTGTDAGPTRRARSAGRCELVELDDPGDPATLLEALQRRKLNRIVCEGGPTLLRDLIAAELVDEADITISPMFAGTERSPDAPMLPEVARFHLAHVLTRDGFLMARYLREQAA
jgi:riboflavin biosynthesis pyrimidine reductase